MERKNKIIISLIGVLSLTFFGLLLFLQSININFVLIFFILSFILCLIRIETVFFLVIFSILFSPEFKIFSLPSFSKPVYVRLEDLLILVGALGMIGNRAIQKKPLFKNTPLNMPILTFLSIYLVATLRGIIVGAIPLSSIFLVLKLIEYFLFYFITVSFLDTPRQCKFLLAAFFVVAFLILGYYFPQSFRMEYPLKVVTSPFEGKPEPTTAGGVLILIMGMAFSLFLYEKRKNTKIIYLLILFLSILPFLGTLSRTSYFAAFIALIFFAFFTRKKWILLLIPLFIGLAPIILPSTVWARISYTWTHRSTWIFDESTMERILVWRKVWWVIKRSPFVGYGAGFLNVIDSCYARIIIESGLLGFAVFI
ncbi:MAG: hypothetical protein DRP67_05630, partial [Candidatus Omnitrophota bacterium]